MFNIGTGEIALIAVAALLLLGPQRLPELARGIGKFMREFRRQTDEVRGVVEREFYKMDQELSIHESPEAPLKPPSKLHALLPEPLIKPNVDALPISTVDHHSQLMKGAPETTPVELPSALPPAAEPVAQTAAPGVGASPESAPENPDKSS